MKQETTMVVYLARRMTVDIDPEWDDDDIREAIYAALLVDPGITCEDACIDDYEIEEDE